MSEQAQLDYAKRVITAFTHLDPSKVTGAKKQGTSLEITIETNSQLCIELLMLADGATLKKKNDSTIVAEHAYNQNGAPSLFQPISPDDVFSSQVFRESLGGCIFQGLGKWKGVGFIKDEEEFEKLKDRGWGVGGVYLEGSEGVDDSSSTQMFGYQIFKDMTESELSDTITKMISLWEFISAQFQQMMVENVASTTAANDDTKTQAAELTQPLSAKAIQEKIEAKEHSLRKMFGDFCDVLALASIMLNGIGSATIWEADSDQIKMYQKQQPHKAH